MKFRLIDIVLSALPAHEDTRYYVHKRTEEAAILVLVEEHTDPVDLGGGDDEHDDAHEDGEVAVGLAGPVHHELPVLLPPLARGEQQAVALEVVLVHGHGDGDAEREDRRDAVTRQLDVEDEVGRLVELRHLLFSLLCNML